MENTFSKGDFKITKTLKRSLLEFDPSAEENINIGMTMSEIVDSIIYPTGLLHQFVLKSGKLGKWKKAPKKDYKIDGKNITYLGKARFIKPIFILEDK